MKVSEFLDNLKKGKSFDFQDYHFEPIYGDFWAVKQGEFEKAYPIWELMEWPSTQLNNLLEFDVIQSVAMASESISDVPNPIVKPLGVQSMASPDSDKTGSKYHDYHINTRGQGILSIPNFIKEIEARGNRAVLTINTSDRRAYHTYFTVDEWNEIKNSLNDHGVGITDVWVTEEISSSVKINSESEKSQIPDGNVKATDITVGHVYEASERYLEESILSLGSGVFRFPLNATSDQLHFIEKEVQRLEKNPTLILVYEEDGGSLIVEFYENSTYRLKQKIKDLFNLIMSKGYNEAQLDTLYNILRDFNNFRIKNN